MGVLGAADRAQRQRSALGFPLAVIYKYSDDQGNYLAAIITYYAFIAIFPLLLLASSILGFILQGRPELYDDVLDSALSQFPIIGDQLGRPEGLQGSAGAVIVGATAALYGSLGLGQALQNALNTAWSVPRNARPNPFQLRFKSLLLLMTAGFAVLAVTILSAVGSSTEVFGERLDATIRWLIRLANILATGAVLTFLFRIAASRRHRIGRAAPGAFTVAVMWQALQGIGAVYVSEVLVKTEGMNQTFGLVLGLIGIIYVAAVMGVLGIEVNVVLARRLWPRSLLTAFTDNGDLTEADRRAYAGYVRAQRHKANQKVDVAFVDAETGEHHVVPDRREVAHAPEPTAPTVPIERPRSAEPQRSGTNE